MNILTVRDNLKNTIEQKEAYLAQMRVDIVKYNQTVNHTVSKFLEINIEELKRILYDIDVCCQMSVDTSAQIVYN